MTFVSYENFLGHICVQIKKQLDFHNQDDFEDENKSLHISESETDHIPIKNKSKKSNMKKSQAKIEKIVEKTNRHSLHVSEKESNYLPKKKKSKKGNMNKAQSKTKKIVEKTNKHSKKAMMPILKRNQRLGKQITAVYESKKPITCDKCQLSFSKSCSLNRHVRTVHEKVKPFRCKLCQLNFSQSIQLKRHVRRVHENDGKRFKLTPNFELKYHNKIVHEGKISHECKDCKAVFGRKSNFTRHVINIHEGKKVS